MRKRDETLRDTLLQCAREMGLKEGMEAINIRMLAKQAGVSVGVIYNYFENKDDILLALTEEYWQNTMREMRESIHGDVFIEHVRAVYAFLLCRMDDAGAQLMGSLRNVEQTGRDKMLGMHDQLRAALVQQMKQDVTIREDIWNDIFTKERYADFVLMNLLMLLQMKAPNIDFFLEIMNKTLYEEEEKENSYGTGNSGNGI